MSLKGKVALVTGSTSGIGEGIARALAEAGADIVFNGFGDAAAIEALRAETASRYGVRAIYAPADISKPADCAAMVEKARSELGGLDILVNNAGIQFTADIEDFPIEKWDQIISINLSGAFYAMHAALRGMKEKGWGRVINISSAHGLVASPQKAAYVAAKHGIIGLTKVAAIECANAGVTVNAICPGWVLTPLVQKQIDARAKENGTSAKEEEAKLVSEKQPMHRFSTPANIAAAALYLCSDGADTVTGISLSVDGGWVAE
ncbi:3-hydroxybutyrate dehydrogenase [Roseomonas sp. NAR14]|uniref:3-hydroxybutyrate dehydrogenase n=1 Tax=Roseomonas acroporae TaxID=2937791 RepID=A0A9X2BXQ2_9PROT|nr:3-hydroxybutyrate dehydrogenase [Roseomonas acroporae]MCK8786194.1 3-hydroxybutyrate dehydrogenase [Roseomonas acroporae]